MKNNPYNKLSEVFSICIILTLIIFGLIYYLYPELIIKIIDE